MRFAVLTDIHANREAFVAVLADAAARDVGRFAILGDIVGYGPDPVWCCDRVATLVGQGALCIQGNHDHAAVAGPDASFSSLARKAILWTRDQLSVAQRAFLGGLPLTATEADVLFVHASANAPGDWIYVRNVQAAMPGFRVSDARVILCGHVHVPALYSCDRSGSVARTTFAMGQPAPLIGSRRWLAVVGAVGQPRDGNPAAGYAILDTIRHELTFRRVPYDSTDTRHKLRAAGLPEPLARRLIDGT
jgi:predicted phosphodiesterase